MVTKGNNVSNNKHRLVISTRYMQRKSPLGTTISKNSIQFWMHGVLKQRKNGMLLHLRNDQIRVKMDMLISSSMKSEIDYKTLVMCLIRSLKMKNALQFLIHLSQLRNMICLLNKRNISIMKLRHLEVKWHNHSPKPKNILLTPIKIELSNRFGKRRKHCGKMLK